MDKYFLYSLILVHTKRYRIFFDVFNQPNSTPNKYYFMYQYELRYIRNNFTNNYFCKIFMIY